MICRPSLLDSLPLLINGGSFRSSVEKCISLDCLGTNATGTHDECACHHEEDLASIPSLGLLGLSNLVPDCAMPRGNWLVMTGKRTRQRLTRSPRTSYPDTSTQTLLMPKAGATFMIDLFNTVPT